VKYRLLGRTGLKVSEICLGCQTFGWGADQEGAIALADYFVEAGGNFFDTSNLYNEGKSEIMLGNWLKMKGNRSKMVVASKVCMPISESPNDAGLSRKHILDQINISLQRLQTDFIDLYQVHCWDPLTPLEETLSTLNDLVRAGKVRYIGASNYTASQLEKAVMLSSMNGLARYDCLQPEYSLLVRSTEWEILPLCITEGIGVIPWSPLAGGWLTGKYRRGKAAPPDSRVGRNDRWDDQEEQRVSEITWKTIDTLSEIGKSNNKTESQVALNWLLNQPGVTAPIIGARNVVQLKDNLGCLDWTLTAEEVIRLNSVSAIKLPSPYDFIARYGRKL